MGMNVLIVEGDTVFGDHVKGLLKGWGHGAETCASGKDALEKCRSGSFDLVVMEALLPDMNGDRLIPQIKQIRPETMIVAMTDRNSFELEVRIREQGILYYMIKSLELENLRPLLDHISMKRRREGERPEGAWRVPQEDTQKKGGAEHEPNDTCRP